MAKHSGRQELLLQSIIVGGIVFPVILFFAIGGFWAYDARTWYLAGQTAYENGLLSVYSIQGSMPQAFPGGYFNYPIPWLICTYLAYAAKQAFGLGLHQWLYLMRLPCLLFTFASALLLHFWVRRKSGELNAALAFFAFTVFPGVANIIFGPIIGYFDPIPVFFTLLALVLFERKKTGWSALSLGLGAAFKYYPLLLLPLFLLSLRHKKGALRFAAIGVTPLALISIPPLAYDAIAYLQAHMFYANWAGSTSLWRLVYLALGWDLHLWFGEQVPQLADLTLLPLVSAASTLLLVAAILFAYFTVYKKKIPLLESSILILMGLLGFWKFAEHNHALWAYPFVLALLFTSKRLRWPAAAWLFAVFLMSLPYVLVVPDWFELLTAMLVPISCMGMYAAIVGQAWCK